MAYAVAVAHGLGHHFRSLSARTNQFSPCLRWTVLESCQSGKIWSRKLCSSALKPHLYVSKCGRRYQTFTALRPRPIRPATRLSQCCGYKLLSFTFVSPIALLKKRLGTDPSEHAEEVLAQIPKEVFRKDVLVKKRKRPSWWKRILLGIWHQFRFTLRFLRVLLTFGPLLSMYPIARLSDSLMMKWWYMLLRACELTGPTYIKLGQWASTRRDLFPDAFCDLFARLHDSTRRHSWFLTQAKLRKAFGPKWRKLFAKIEKKPVGSGCIAQVHKGWMRIDMIPDESIVEEALTEMEDSDVDPNSEVDFSDGLEILGFGAVADAQEEVSEFIGSKFKRKDKHTPVSTIAAQHMPTISSGEEGQQIIQPPDATSSTPAATSENGNTTSGTNRDSEMNPVYDHPYLRSPRIHKTAEFMEGEAVIPVAIKVLHPSIFKSFSRDLAILRTVVKIGEWLFPNLRWLSLHECVEEFAGLMTRQIDLRHEATCLEQFVDNFEELPHIRFPKPIQPYCKRDVLVETWEEGIPINNFIREDNPEPWPVGLKDLLAGYGADALLQMIFVDNLVHGDLHPGNILVQNAHEFQPQEEEKYVMVDLCDTIIVNVKPQDCPVRLVLLDAGIATSVSEEDLRNFKAVFTAVILGEGERVADLMLKYAKYHECKDVQSFRDDLGKIVDEARENTITLGKVIYGKTKSISYLQTPSSPGHQQIHVGELLSKVFHAVTRHKVKIDSHFASILLAVFVLEGLGRSLDPDLDLLERAKPILLA